MLELAILGFLAEGPLHAYLVRKRIEQLAGYARPVSDGSLYPAVARLVDAGLIERREEAGLVAARKQVLHLTRAGRADLQRRLRDVHGYDITDFSRFATVLAFLGHLDDVEEQHAVLRRRLAFLEQPASFFYENDRPLRQEDMTDPYRAGLLVIARATSTAERTWLRRTLGTV